MNHEPQSGIIRDWSSVELSLCLASPTSACSEKTIMQTLKNWQPVNVTLADQRRDP